MKQEMTGGSGIIWTICKSFAAHSRQCFNTGRMLFLMLSQQCQSSEGKLGPWKTVIALEMVVVMVKVESFIPVLYSTRMVKTWCGFGCDRIAGRSSLLSRGDVGRRKTRRRQIYHHCTK